MAATAKKVAPTRKERAAQLIARWESLTLLEGEADALIDEHIDASRPEGIVRRTIEVEFWKDIPVRRNLLAGLREIVASPYDG
jgi:hypothetical protein